MNIDYEVKNTKYNTDIVKRSSIKYNPDDNIDLYMALKRNKMISAVPVFLAYYGDNKKRDKWFIPDDSLIGADETQVKQFFQRCLDKASKINEIGYSYFS